MVRVVIRPWPRSICRWAIGVSVQGSASSAANRPGWLCLTVNEPSPAFVQVLRVAALGVECVGGDHGVGQVDPAGGELVEKRGEHRDLVGLRTDLNLAEDQGVVVSRGGEQMGLIALGVRRAAHRLAVDRDREQLR